MRADKAPPQAKADGGWANFGLWITEIARGLLHKDADRKRQKTNYCRGTVGRLGEAAWAQNWENRKRRGCHSRQRRNARGPRGAGPFLSFGFMQSGKHDNGRSEEHTVNYLTTQGDKGWLEAAIVAALGSQCAVACVRELARLS